MRNLEAWDWVRGSACHYLNTILIIRTPSLTSLLKVSPSTPSTLILFPALFYYIALTTI